MRVGACVLLCSCGCVRVCPRLCSWMSACACGRACWSVQSCVSLCVRARARTHLRVRARQFSCARASVLVHMQARLRMCQCVLVRVSLGVCLCACACACVRAHMRGRVDAPLRVLCVAHGRFSRGKPPPRCVESPPAAPSRRVRSPLNRCVSRPPHPCERSHARGARVPAGTHAVLGGSVRSFAPRVRCAHRR